MVRCVLIQSGMEKQFWNEAARTATYIINRTETRTLPAEQTPAEIWFKRKIDLSNIRIFGSEAYAHVPKEERNKLDERSKQMVMIGYSPNGYRLWNSEENKVVTARSVVFDENNRECRKMCEKNWGFRPKMNF
ncbi:hypothetical protein QE152_g29305 [Popillia japonica]|uniref:Retroviral polymerase SH3-like domain-containing protein n=1 Tax=Popillia japonica TaxID=7064 RepID=A0AAW1JJC8_POPJA